MGAVREFSTRTRWSRADEWILEDHYANADWSALESVLHRPRRVITCKANGMGLVRAKTLPRTPNQVREAKRLHMAERRSKDPEGVRSYQRANHAKNRELNCAKLRDYFGRRFFWGRAIKLRGDGRATSTELAWLWIRQRGLCALTGRPLGRDAHLDHIVPRASGGNDRVGNLRWTCPSANLAKRALSDADFLRLCEDVASWSKRK